YSDSFLDFTLDVNQDGWVDFIRIDFPGESAFWYQNPEGKDTHWEEYVIDTNACNESPMMVDVDRDGRMDLVFGHEPSGEMMWFRAPEDGRDLTWQSLAISTEKSPGTEKFSHGLGFGDVNNDGRNDIIIREGW